MDDIELNEHWLVQKAMYTTKGLVLSGSPELVGLFADILDSFSKHTIDVVNGKILSGKN